MQRWKWSNSSRKRNPYFPLLVLFLVAFIAFSTLHSEHSFNQIHENPDHARTHQEEHVSVTYVKPNLLNRASEVLDRFSRCNSTVEYSGRRIDWLGGAGAGAGGSRGSSSHRRVGAEKCDVFSGKWVFDNGSYPLYNEGDCPYMSDQLACHKHGRNDLGYQHWRWQPHNCNLKSQVAVVGVAGVNFLCLQLEFESSAVGCGHNAAMLQSSYVNGRHRNCCDSQPQPQDCYSICIPEFTTI